MDETKHLKSLLRGFRKSHKRGKEVAKRAYDRGDYRLALEIVVQMKMLAECIAAVKEELAEAARAEGDG